MKKRLLILGICLMIISIFSVPAIASIITGTIYDLDFEPVQNVLVRIDTEPAQTFVALDGTYRFFVDSGDYKLTVEEYQDNELLLVAEEDITITNNGTYNLDLILLPYLDDLEDDLELIDEELDFSLLEDEPKSNNTLIIIIIAIITIIVLLYFFIPKKKPDIKELAGEEDKILDYIKEHKHVTQKDIRKEFPLSEAKISLVISDLENQGKIRKIKKGRGNIVVYEN